MLNLLWLKNCRLSYERFQHARIHSSFFYQTKSYKAKGYFIFSHTGAEQTFPKGTQNIFPGSQQKRGKDFQGFRPKKEKKLNFPIVNQRFLL